MFRSTLNKGFQLTFKNGLTISVQWGTGNYCARHSVADGAGSASMRASIWDSPDAEVMIWDENDKTRTQDFFPDLKNDEVVGRLSTDDIADILAKVASA